MVDEQFGKFVEVIKKLYLNMLLLDTMHDPTYAKYLKDILGNKRALATIEVVQLTKESRMPHHHMFNRSSTLACSL